MDPHHRFLSSTSAHLKKLQLSEILWTRRISSWHLGLVGQCGAFIPTTTRPVSHSLDTSVSPSQHKSGLSNENRIIGPVPRPCTSPYTEIRLRQLDFYKNNPWFNRYPSAILISGVFSISLSLFFWHYFSLLHYWFKARKWYDPNMLKRSAAPTISRNYVRLNA